MSNIEETLETIDISNNNEDPLEKVVLDARFMCKRVIDNMNLLLPMIENKQHKTVLNDLGNLFDKMACNIKVFKETLNLETEMDITPRSKKKVSLCLKKYARNDSNLTEDFDLHTSINFPLDIVKKEKNANAADESTSTPVPVSEHNSESFDFDEDDEHNNEAEEISPTNENESENFIRDNECNDQIIQPEPAEQADGAQSKPDNKTFYNDLLLLLTRVTEVNADISDNEDPIDDKTAEAALESLESSSSSSTDDESTSLSFSDQSFDIESIRSNNEEGNKSLIEQDEKFTTATEVNLTRLEDLEDHEINRLCDLNNINKRKLTSTVNLPNAKKTKRVLPLPSSSSESDTQTPSDFTSGTITPDLEEIVPTTANFETNEYGLEYVEKLAEMISCLTSEEEYETEIDEEDNETVKKKTSIETKNETDEEVTEIKSESQSDTDSDSDSDSTLIVPKSSWPKDPVFNDLLFDSDTSEEEVEINTISSDNDSDVEFIMEGSFEENTKGRRNIREIISDDELNEATQRAKIEEDRRIQRLEEISKTREVVLSQCEEGDEFVLDVDIEAEKPLVVVDRKLTKKLKPHQRNGVQFMWDICYESVKICQTSNGTGCILAHSMGLGKTLQVITLIHTLYAHPITKTNRVLIVCPLSTVNNWHNEFRMAFALAEKKVKIPVYPVEKANLREKIQLINSWKQSNGVLIIGYESFQILTSDKNNKKVSAAPLSLIKEMLVKPGPDLIVCDEGHILKNGETLRTQALMKVKTKRRIVLTGTPLQNNLQEYYFMVQFVKPNLLGTFEEYKNRFAHPITNGQYYNSTPQDIKLMKQRTHVLTKVLKKTIDRVESKVLEQYLPEIYDHTIFVTLHPVQEEIYKHYMNIARNFLITSSNRKCGFLTDFQITKYITLHPWVIDYYYKNKKKVLNPEQPQQDENRPNENWYKEFTSQSKHDSIEYGTKLDAILRIIDETITQNDKLLVFSSSLVELDCIEHFLTKHGTNLCRTWKLNQNYYRMDGTVSSEKRSNLCASFNSKSNDKVRIFLISHRVGGLGLNLTAANRVVLIGSNFNPSHDTQSIYRVYRFGQEKKCYVYRILTIGTMEEKIYNRCVVKLALAGTVVDKMHIDRHFKSVDLEELYENDFEAFRERPIPAVPQDTLLAKLLHSCAFIYKYHEHDALLRNRPEEELNDEDKKLAWEEFNNIEAMKNNAPMTVLNGAQTIQRPPFPVNLPGLPQPSPRYQPLNPAAGHVRMIQPPRMKYAPAGQYFPVARPERFPNPYCAPNAMNSNNGRLQGQNGSLRSHNGRYPPPPPYRPRGPQFNGIQNPTPGPSGVQRFRVRPGPDHAIPRPRRDGPVASGASRNEQILGPYKIPPPSTPVEFNYHLNKAI